MRLLHAANLVCLLAQTPLVGAGLVSHSSEWQSMMVCSTPGRLLETKRHRGLLANMVCGDGPPAHGPATLPLQGDERQSSERNRPSWPNTLRTAPARRSAGPDRPTRLMGCTFICSVAPSFVRLRACLFGYALVCSVAPSFVRLRSCSFCRALVCSVAPLKPQTWPPELEVKFPAEKLNFELSPENLKFSFLSEKLNSKLRVRNSKFRLKLQLQNHV